MRLLLDTHALYWYIEGDPQLSGTAQTLIQDASNEILISPASYWEMAIKVSLGKWVLNRPYEEFIDLSLNQYEFLVLPIFTSIGSGEARFADVVVNPGIAAAVRTTATIINVARSCSMTMTLRRG